MPGNYKVTIVNNAPVYAGIVLYQSLPEGQGSLVPLAWFTAQCMPGTSRTFVWESRLAFVCGGPSQLAAGAVFEATDTLDYSSAWANQVTLGYDRGLRFRDHNGRGPNGRLQVVQDAALPVGAGAVGFAVGGCPALVQAAEPGRVLTILPRPDYWIGLGTHKPGEALDPATVGSAARLPLPSGDGAVVAVLGPDMSWGFRSEE